MYFVVDNGTRCFVSNVVLHRSTRFVAAQNLEESLCFGMLQIYLSEEFNGQPSEFEFNDNDLAAVCLLLIDDDDQVRRLFQVALERAGYRVLTAESGPHGLRLLQHQEVDLILVDIFMPDMDGLEVIQLLRKSRPLSKIIATSGESGDRKTQSELQSPC